MMGEVVRKLASIQSVEAVEPIEGADAIEKVRVLGWWVVVKKGEYQPGDRVVYCEIDSMLPERDEFEFLRKYAYRPPIVDSDGTIREPGGFRVKTAKLRGQISQGICFPLSILPDGCYEHGTDISAVLGVRKWEPPATGGLAGNPKGSFPGFLSKTDEERIQSNPRILRDYAGQTAYVTEKLDGTSFTAYLRDGQYGVCSRNLELDLDSPGSLLVDFARRWNIQEVLYGYGFNVAIQGELIGPRIQGNKYALSEHELRVFNVINLDIGARLPLSESILPTVPVLGEVSLPNSVDEMVKMSEGASVLNPKTQREGIVVRLVSDPHVSFKVINPKFLLKWDE